MVSHNIDADDIQFDFKFKLSLALGRCADCDVGGAVAVDQVGDHLPLLFVGGVENLETADAG
jgi:hypothetical protein